jgi:hypothetical protein
MRPMSKTVGIRTTTMSKRSKQQQSPAKNKRIDKTRIISKHQFDDNNKQHQQNDNHQ